MEVTVKNKNEKKVAVLSPPTLVAAVLMITAPSIVANADVTLNHVARGDERNSAGQYTKWVSQASVDNSSDGWVGRTKEIRTYGAIEIDSQDGQIDFRAPVIKLKDGFHAAQNSHFSASLPTFKVNFINMVSPCWDPSASATHYPAPLHWRNKLPTHCCQNAAGNPVACSAANAVPSNPNASWLPGFFGQYPGTGAGQMTQDAFVEFCRNEIDILNHSFINEDGNPMARFIMSNAIRWNESMRSTDFYQCKSFGNTQADCPVDPNIWVANADAAYNLPSSDDGTFTSFKNSSMINVIFFDNPENEKFDSGGTSNLSGQNPEPFIVIDWSRVETNMLDNNGDGLPDDNGNGVLDDDPHRGGVESHEMGHAFGVHHVCTQNPTVPDDNIMYSTALTGTQTIPAGLGNCTSYCDDDPATATPPCNQWGDRSSGFEFAPHSALDPWEDSNGDGILDSPPTAQFIQSYSTGSISYTGTITDYGQAEIVMSMSRFFEDYLQ